MKGLHVPAPLRDRLPDAASEGLVDMFAEAHRLATESFERRLREATDSFERRLGEEVGKLRLEIADLRFEILTWSFLFWIGQVAVTAGIFSVLLGRLR